MDNPFAALHAAANQTVRVAEISQADSKDAPIKLSLKNIQPSDNYQCISYDRSKSFESADVQIDDEQVSIPGPLETALRALRSNAKSKLLWADLLNGTSQAERNAQAARSKLALENAESVIAWVGPGDERMGDAFKVLKTLANRWYQATVHANMSQEMSQMSPSQLMAAREHLLSSSRAELRTDDAAVWANIRKVLGSSYFKTIQSIPEVVLSKKTIVASTDGSILWDDFIAASRAAVVLMPALEMPQEPEVLEGLGLVDSLRIARRRYHEEGGLGLLPMIQSSRICSAADPREFIFSMLPIVSPSKRVQYTGVKLPPLQADYAKTTAEVYQEAAAHIIQERQDLLIWWKEQPPCFYKGKDLPSWVPDWSSGQSQTTVILTPNSKLREWTDAMPASLNKKQIRVEDNKLLLQACPFDRIVHVSAPFTLGNCRRQCLSLWQALPTMPNEKLEDKVHRMWRTLVLDSAGPGATLRDTAKPPKETWLSFQSLLAEERILELLGCTGEELAASTELQAKMREHADIMTLGPQTGNSQAFLELLVRNAMGRRFFVTAKGHTGMTGVEWPGFKLDLAGNIIQDDSSTTSDPEIPPNATKAGDLVVVLVGGFYPYILRPTGVRAQAGLDDPVTGGMAQSMITAFQQHLREQGQEAAAKLVEEQFLQQPADGDEYHYVNDAYVHGIMEGEHLRTVGGWFSRSTWKADVQLVDIKLV